MKYIDADKLIAEIERRRADAKLYDMSGGNAPIYDELLSIIGSLQQQPRFPQYDNIVDKVFGAGNLEGWERDEAEMLVALAKEELLKSLQQKQPETPSGEEVMTMCNQILIDWVKEGKTPEEREQREQAHIRFFELYDEYMQEQPEVDLKEEAYMRGFAQGAKEERESLSHTMLTYVADVFSGKMLLEDISYSYRQELADYFRDLAREIQAQIKAQEE